MKLDGETLKLLDWVKDAEVIEQICKVSNPKFFTSRKPQQCIEAVKEDIAFNKFFENRDNS